MIELRQGDILHADTEAVVNTVNCVGVMGRGIALQFRKAFPENFKRYKAVCDRKELAPGKILFFDLNRWENPRYVLNFPTKRHWKGKSRIEYIESGLRALVDEVRQRGIRSIAIPPLGCGLGGLNWQVVKPMIEQALGSLPDVEVFLYEPGHTPAPVDMVIPKGVPKMTVGQATLLVLMRRYLAAVMDPFITLLEIHKLMYFMQEAGQKLRLDYHEGTYGPYAKNLRHVLSKIEGHFITGYGDAEDRPDIRIELKPEAADAAELLLKNHPTTHSRFNRVAALIEGFETASGMELLATVHWVARHQGASTPEEAVSATYAWNDRKAMFQEKHIRLVWDILNETGWLGKN